MVMFVCNTCGESLKKNKVDEHWMHKCRNCESVSCIDCGVDFWGDDYQGHIKCISEQEKYQGIPTENKGEQKQEQWVNNVTDVISTYKGNPRVRKLLQKCVECSNLPRKQKKFVNFVKSSFHETDPAVLNEAWAIMESASKPKVNSSSSKPPTVAVEAKEDPEPELEPLPEPTESAQDEEDSPEVEGAAAEEEEEDKATEELTEKQKKKKQKKDKMELAALQNANGKKLSKKQLKRLREESISLELAQTETIPPLPEKGEKKSKKNKHKLYSDAITEPQHTEPKTEKPEVIAGLEDFPQNLNAPIEEVDENVCEQKGPFNWHKAIKTALKSEEDKSLPVKKLRKKVLAEFMLTGGEVKLKNENEIYALFDKKLHSYPKVKVLKDRVTLMK